VYCEGGAYTGEVACFASGCGVTAGILADTAEEGAAGPLVAAEPDTEEEGAGPDTVEIPLTTWAAAVLTRARPKMIDFIIKESGLRGAIIRMSEVKSKLD
jgi:hypothetical protein